MKFLAINEHIYNSSDQSNLNQLEHSPSESQSQPTSLNSTLSNMSPFVSNRNCKNIKNCHDLWTTFFFLTCCSIRKQHKIFALHLDFSWTSLYSMYPLGKKQNILFAWTVLVLPVFKCSHLDKGTVDGKQEKHVLSICTPISKHSKLTHFLSQLNWIKFNLIQFKKQQKKSTTTSDSGAINSLMTKHHFTA